MDYPYAHSDINDPTTTNSLHVDHAFVMLTRYDDVVFCLDEHYRRHWHFQKESMANDNDTLLPSSERLDVCLKFDKANFDKYFVAHKYKQSVSKYLEIAQDWHTTPPLSTIEFYAWIDEVLGDMGIVITKVVESGYYQQHPVFRIAVIDEKTALTVKLMCHRLHEGDFRMLVRFIPAPPLGLCL